MDSGNEDMNNCTRDKSTEQVDLARKTHQLTNMNTRQPDKAERSHAIQSIATTKNPKAAIINQTAIHQKRQSSPSGDENSDP